MRSELWLSEQFKAVGLTYDVLICDAARVVNRLLELSSGMIDEGDLIVSPIACRANGALMRAHAAMYEAAALNRELYAAMAKWEGAMVEMAEEDARQGVPEFGSADYLGPALQRLAMSR